MSLVWGLLWLTTCPAIAEPTGPAPSESTESTPEAADITDLVEVMARVERFSGVAVTADGPVVRLTGVLPSLEARQELQQLASRLTGARFVDDLTTVDVEEVDASARQASEDAAMARTLRGLFSEIEAFAEVDVQAANGVVHLSGTVLDGDSHDRAVQLAEGLPGVVYVEDGLQVNTELGDQLAPAMQAVKKQVTSLFAWTPLFLVALGVFLLSWLVSRLLTNWSALYMRLDERPLLQSTIRRLVGAAALLIGTVAALEILDATSLASGLLGTAGVFGLAVGFAFQDIIENYLAGILLSIQQPFSKDDLIEVAGVLGVVVRLTRRNTLLLTMEGNHVFLPNATVFKSNLTNYSRNPHRRFDFLVGVGVEEDLASVIDTGVATLHDIEGVGADPRPAVLIEELGDSSVVMQVLGWVDQRRHSWIAVRTEAIRRVKEAFDDAGYDMPEPIYRVQMQDKKPANRPDRPSRRSGPAVDVRSDRQLEKEITDQAREERLKEQEKAPQSDLLPGGPAQG